MKRPGLTIVECLLATTILTAATLGVLYTVVAGHQHIHHGDMTVKAMRLAQDLLEEIVSRPIDDGTPSGATQRAAFNIADYDGFSESAGKLEDFAGNLYPEPEQLFGRSVSVAQDTQFVDELDRDFEGLTATVFVQHTNGEQWQFHRFIPRPPQP